MNNEVMVSIICNTFNHEKYVEQAIIGFISQETTFNYEVLIHDDASTDNTQSIIKEYQMKYPDIIKPIFQAENQYSKNIDNSRCYQYPRALGKYIAFCEGDDYWIDPHKLQKQVEELNNHPEIDMCVHAAYMYQDDERIGELAPFPTDCIIKTEDVIKLGGGMVASNSWLFRRELIEDIPLFRQKYNIDYAIQIHGSLRGGILYLNEYMSVYNYMNSGSWTRKRKENNNFAIKASKKTIEMLEELNVYTKGRYKSIIEQKILLYEYEVKWYEDDMRGILADKKIFLSLPTREKIKVLFKLIFPNIYNYFWRIKYKL